jgi:DNA polymerase-1
MDIHIADVIYRGPHHEELNKIYEDLEFYSYLKKEEPKPTKLVDFKVINDVKDIKITKECAVYLEILGSNYHTSKILGMGVYSLEDSFYIPLEVLKKQPKFLTEVSKYTYDLKKLYVALKWLNIKVDNVIFDTMLAGYLLDYNVKDDIGYLANQFDFDIPFYESVYGRDTKLEEPKEDIIAYNAISKAKFIYESYKPLKDKLINEEQYDLFNNIELPLTIVLGDMEYDGVNVNTKELQDMGTDIDIKIELVSKDIYNLSGVEFNISSPNQLGKVLFERIGLPHSKKGANGYSTAIDVLTKLRGKHPIIEHIIEYRNLSKLKSTYIDGLLATVMHDGKIHTIYNQVIARTGRLSSIEPNLQNIPIRSEYGRMIRKAFVPSDKSVILSGDYSQIELRILAHIANIPSLKEAFINNLDIHTKTASDIFKVEPDLVTKDMRRIAKAVNFGIIYGISSFGLSENLDISMSEAKQFIDNYLKTYPGIKDYMDSIIKKAYQDGFVKTLFNRKRVLNELKNTNYMIRGQGERMALNTPIQGTSADIIKKAMIEIHNEFKKENINSKMILQVHDELVFDCLESEINIVQKIITNIMENTFKLSVPLKIEVDYGKNWYQAK